jgi:uncharacterized membrane protein YgcG
LIFQHFYLDAEFTLKIALILKKCNLFIVSVRPIERSIVGKKEMVVKPYKVRNSGHQPFLASDFRAQNRRDLGYSIRNSVSVVALASSLALTIAVLPAHAREDDLTVSVSLTGVNTNADGGAGSAGGDASGSNGGDGGNGGYGGDADGLGLSGYGGDGAWGGAAGDAG